METMLVISLILFVMSLVACICCCHDCKAYRRLANDYHYRLAAKCEECQSKQDELELQHSITNGAINLKNKAESLCSELESELITANNRTYLAEDANKRLEQNVMEDLKQLRAFRADALTIAARLTKERDSLAAQLKDEKSRQYINTTDLLERVKQQIFQQQKEQAKK